MYPWELEEFIKKRNYVIGGEDLLKVISTNENPQLIQVTLYPGNNRYELKDEFMNHYTFTVLPYEEETTLTRSRTKENISK